MQQSNPADIAVLEDAFDAVEEDARALVVGLSETLGAWRVDSRSWSVAECLDHLAIANRVYLRAMQPVAERALMQGSTRRGPAQPGVIGSWFIRTLEPPVKPRLRTNAPQSIRPRRAPSLGDAIAQFLASHDEVRTFLRRYAHIDLARMRFPNPFIRGIRFTLATGLHVIAAHERRHLWQAWRVRQAAERAVAA
jgi:DinB superfamily